MSTTVVNRKAYLLGLDAGNTVIKAVLFDLRGHQVAMHAIDGTSYTPRPGYVERDLTELWRNAREAIRACIREAGIDPRAIAAVGCAGHGNGLYLVDDAGRPLIGIQSLDTRAADLAASLSAKSGSELHAICLQQPWPSQTPTLLAWVKANTPATYERTSTVMLCKDFITFRLTGERVSDISDMSGCGFVRMPEAAYDDRLLALYGLEDARSKLPRLLDPAAVAGAVTAQAADETGLAEGTPVIAGYFDVVSSAMGAGVVGPGEASIIAGTWSINQVFSDAPVVDSKVFMAARFGPGRFVNIEFERDVSGKSRMVCARVGRAREASRRSVRILQRAHRRSKAGCGRSYIPSVPVWVAAGFRVPRGLLRHGQLAQGRASAACALRGRDVRTSPAYWRIERSGRLVRSCRSVWWWGAQPALAADVCRRSQRADHRAGSARDRRARRCHRRRRRGKPVHQLRSSYFHDDAPARHLPAQPRNVRTLRSPLSTV